MLGDHVVDHVLVPGRPVTGLLLSLGLGTLITSLLRCINYAPTLPSTISSIINLIITRVFTLLFFCTYMLLWRGWWGLLTVLQLPDLLLLCSGLGLLLVTDTLGTNVGAPLAFSRDYRQGEFNIAVGGQDNGRLTPSSRRTYLTVPLFQSSSSMLLSIVATAVLEVPSICCWFSTWLLTNYLLSLVTDQVTNTTTSTTKTQELTDSFLSLALGIITGGTAFLLQVPLIAV